MFWRTKQKPTAQYRHPIGPGLVFDQHVMRIIEAEHLALAIEYLYLTGREVYFPCLSESPENQVMRVWSIQDLKKMIQMRNASKTYEEAARVARVRELARLRRISDLKAHSSRTKRRRMSS